MQHCSNLTIFSRLSEDKQHGGLEVLNLPSQLKSRDIEPVPENGDDDIQTHLYIEIVLQSLFNQEDGLFEPCRIQFKQR
jgi:hypothetical protein